MTDVRFVSAGYFLVRACPRPQWAHGGAHLLPATVITLSPCLTDVLPNLWPSPCSPAARPDEASLARLGIAPAEVGRLEAWAATRCDAQPDEWPLPFATLEELREVVRDFVALPADVRLVGAALPADLVDGFLAGGEAGGGASERVHALRRGLAPDPRGDFIGYEVLGNGTTELHSILCTGGEVPLHDVLGITLNAYGLVDDLDDARRAATWASADGHAEPVDYLPWRLAWYVPT